MDIHPIRTTEDYRAMLAEVSALVDMDPDPDTPEGERLDVLSTLIEAYERNAFRSKHRPLSLQSDSESSNKARA